MLNNIIPIIMIILIISLTIVPIMYLIYNCIRLERERNDLSKINDTLLDEVNILKIQLPIDWDIIKKENEELKLRVADLRSLRQLDSEARERLLQKLDEVTAKLKLQDLIKEVTEEMKRFKDGI